MFIADPILKTKGYYSLTEKKNKKKKQKKKISTVLTTPLESTRMTCGRSHSVVGPVGHAEQIHTERWFNPVIALDYPHAIETCLYGLVRF